MGDGHETKPLQGLGALADSGKRETFTTGAMREPNPLRFDLIPYEPLERLALHYSNGAAKYDARNWERGLSFKRCFTSTVNHLFKWSRNKALNLPMEEDHLAAAVWNLFAIMTYERRIERGWLPEDLDDFETVPVNPRLSKRAKEAEYASGKPDINV